MSVEIPVSAEQMRCWRRWIGTLEGMLRVLQTTPMPAGKKSRWIREEDLSLCRYLRDLSEQGRMLMKQPVFARQLRDFEVEYRAAVSWFHEFQRDRDPHWKL